MVSFTVRDLCNDDRSECEMIEEKDIAKATFKIKIGEIILSKAVGYSDTYLNPQGAQTVIATLDELNAMGATVVKEPRRMSVWEWRNVGGVEFVADGDTLVWLIDDDMGLCLLDTDGHPISAVASLLESEGVEVLE